MKNLGILFEPNKTVSTSAVAEVCRNDSYLGEFEMWKGGRDNPTGENFVWGYGINKGVNWMDGKGLQTAGGNPPNRGEAFETTIGGKPVTVTVWSLQIGRSSTSVASPANTFFQSTSAELPRVSMQLEALIPPNAPGAPNSPCFNATHAGIPYAGGTTVLYFDGHVKWETYVAGTTPAGSPGGGKPQVFKDPCGYYATEDPGSNPEGCKNGWR
jgi:prepilin-type processing-associated H-X9-DG protein